MAVESLCPICGATYNLADDMHGKKVKCKKCEHNFTVGGEAAAKKRRQEEEEDEERVTTKAGKGKKDDDDEKSKKNRRYHDDEKEKADGKKLSEQVQRKGTTEQKTKAKTTPVKSIVIGAICLVILVGCCGGGSFAVIYVRKKAADVVVDAGNHPPPNNGGGGGGIGGGGFGGGGIGGGVVKPPKIITSVDDAVNWLRSPSDDERKKGAEWLQKAPVDPGRRGDVSRQLEVTLSDQNEDVAEAAAKALVPWATKDNVPELIHRVEDQTFGFRAGKLRPHAIAALARLKDPRAAPALAARLSDNEFRERAREALIAIGPGGETAVRGQLSSNKKEVRDAAVAILASYGVKENFTLTQALADLKGGDHRRREKDTAAATILAQPVEEKRRAEVLQALEAAMQDRSPFGGADVIRAYAAWSTKENIPTLAKQLDHPNAQARKTTIDALVKIPDARSVKPLVERLADRTDRTAVSTALQTLGADPTLTNATETEVLSLLESSADRDTRVECCKILGAVGTKAVSMPALMKIDQDTTKNAQQRLLNTAAKNAVAAITQRGK